MSKVYKTSEKHLVTIHRPEYPDVLSDLGYSDDDEEIENIAIDERITDWNPINDQFFHDDESNDEDENEIETNFDDEIDDPSTNSVTGGESDLQWDSSPEQIALIQDDIDLAAALEPRRLFAATDDDQDDDLTSSTDEEVFTRDNFQTPPSTPKLQRRNAMLHRYKLKANSEPRITRTLLKSNRYQFLSNPTSPSHVILDQPQKR